MFDALASGQIGQVFQAQIFSTIWLWTKLILFFAVIVFIFAFAYKYFFSYNVYIKIKKRVGSSGTECFNDKGKYIQDEQGKYKIVLQKSKRGRMKLSCPKPDPIFYQNIKTIFGKKDYIELWLDDTGSLYPVMPPMETDDVFKINAIPQERIAWQLSETRRLTETYKQPSFWEKHQATIITVAAMMIAFLMIFFGLKYAVEMAGGLSRSISELAAAVTSLQG